MSFCSAKANHSNAAFSTAAQGACSMVCTTAALLVASSGSYYLQNLESSLLGVMAGALQCRGSGLYLRWLMQQDVDHRSLSLIATLSIGMESMSIYHMVLLAGHTGSVLLWLSGRLWRWKAWRLWRWVVCSSSGQGSSNQSMRDFSL